MSQYTVLNVEHKKDVEGKFGPLRIYGLNVQGDPAKPPMEVELCQKTTSPPPSAGDTINGTVEETEFGLKIKKDFTPGAPGQRPRDPVDIASIQRQHSQEMALRFLSVAQNLDLLRGVTSREALLSLTEELTDSFEDDIPRGAQRKAAA